MYSPKYSIGEPVYVLQQHIRGPFPHDYIIRITKTVIVNMSFQVSYHNEVPKGLSALGESRPSDIVIDSVTPKYKTAHIVEWLPEDKVFKTHEEAEKDIQQRMPGLYRNAEHYDADRSKVVDATYYSGVKIKDSKMVIIYNEANI